jgi:hypothetical protein
MLKRVVLLAGLVVAGCYETPGTGELLMSREDKDAKDDAACRRYGAVPGTDLYVTCRMQQDQTRASVKAQMAAAARPRTCTSYGSTVTCY